MEEICQRLQLSATHLKVIDRIFANLDPLYGKMRKRLTNLDSYPTISEQLYGGQQGRQMIISDLLIYILTGRGYWAATESEESFKDYIRAILYVINMLLIQESILSARVKDRKRFLRLLKEEDIEHFFKNDTERETYKELRDYEGLITVKEPRKLYKMMDSLLPKSIGTVIELMTYVHLLTKKLGYAVPLLFIQRIFRGMDNLAPPDYLLVRENSVFGIEVGAGIGRFSLSQGKIEQVNRFAQDTGIPVLTATAPHLYRCEHCNEWIVFCNEVIERTANGETSEYLTCVDCPNYNGGKCPNIIYYGQPKKNNKRFRFHYQHFINNKYVQTVSLSTPEKKRSKLIHYFPYVQGFERLKGH